MLSSILAIVFVLISRIIAKWKIILNTNRLSLSYEAIRGKSYGEVIKNKT